MVERKLTASSFDLMTHRLNVVTIRIQHERRVILTRILWANPGCAVVFATRCNRRVIERINLMPTLGNERDVQMCWLLICLVQA